MYHYTRHPATGYPGVWIDGEFIPVLAGGKGGGGSTTVTSVVNVPPKTAEEAELDAINLEVAKSQRDQILVAQARSDPAAARAYLDSVKAGATPAGRFKGLELFDDAAFRTQLSTDETQAARTKEFDDLIYNQLRGRLTGEAFLTGPEQATLDKMFASAEARGVEDLRKFGEEIAGLRGMRPSDSPIGHELVRERGRLSLGLESAKAASMLDLTQGQKNFEESIRQFQEGLRNTAFENRLALAAIAPLSFNLSAQLANKRFQGISQTSTTSNRPSFAETAGGIGGLITAGSLGARTFL